MKQHLIIFDNKNLYSYVSLKYKTYYDFSSNKWIYCNKKITLFKYTFTSIYLMNK